MGKLDVGKIAAASTNALTFASKLGHKPKGCGSAPPLNLDSLPEGGAEDSSQTRVLVRVRMRRSGGHILRYDTTQLENGGYTFGLVTQKQKTIKKFGVKN
jgi:hypothetical protein